MAPESALLLHLGSRLTEHRPRRASRDAHGRQRHVVRHRTGGRSRVRRLRRVTFDGPPRRRAAVTSLHLHRRFDRLTGAWVLISPARNTRPGGTIARARRHVVPAVPGRARAALAVRGGGVRQPLPVAGAAHRSSRRRTLTDRGVDGSLPGGRVHARPLAARSLTELSGTQLVELVAVLRERTRGAVGRGPRVRDGVREPRRRGRRHARPPARPDLRLRRRHLPVDDRTKLDAARPHRRAEQRRCLGCTLVAEDLASERVLVANDSFTVAVPYAARWPFEVHVRAPPPRRRSARRPRPTREVIDLAACCRRRRRPLRRAVRHRPPVHDVRAGGAA